MCIVLLYKNTRVSEMTASFTRMGVSRKVTVPVAVAIRYIPTLKEEWLHIRDAMRISDERMYEDKVKYYKKHPERKRK